MVEQEFKSRLFDSVEGSLTDGTLLTLHTTDSRVQSRNVSGEFKCLLAAGNNVEIVMFLIRVFC